MNLFLVCFLVVGNHSNHDLPRQTIHRCDTFEAGKLTDEVVDAMLHEAAVKYDACETPLVSIRRIGKKKGRLTSYSLIGLTPLRIPWWGFRVSAICMP